MRWWSGQAIPVASRPMRDAYAADTAVEGVARREYVAVQRSTGREPELSGPPLCTFSGGTGNGHRG